MSNNNQLPNPDVVSQEDSKDMLIKLINNPNILKSLIDLFSDIDSLRKYLRVNQSLEPSRISSSTIKREI